MKILRYLDPLAMCLNMKVSLLPPYKHPVTCTQAYTSEIQKPIFCVNSIKSTLDNLGKFKGDDINTVEVETTTVEKLAIHKGIQYLDHLVEYEVEK